MRKLIRLSLFPLLLSSAVSADPQASPLETDSPPRGPLYEELQKIFTDLEGASTLEGRTSEALSRIEASRKLSHLGKKLDETLITLNEANLAAAKVQIERLKEELKLITSGLESGTQKKLEAADIILSHLNELGRGGESSFADISGSRDKSNARLTESLGSFSLPKKPTEDLDPLSPLETLPVATQASRAAQSLRPSDLLDHGRDRPISVTETDGYQASPLAEFVQANQHAIVHTPEDLALLSRAKGSLKALVDRGLSPRAATELFGTFAQAMGCTALDFEKATQKSVKAFFKTAAPFFESYGQPEDLEEEALQQRPENRTPPVVPEERPENPKPTPARARVILDLAENLLEDPLGGLPGIAEVIEASTTEELEETLSDNVIEVVKYGGVREGTSVVRTLAKIYNESNPEQQYAIFMGLDKVLVNTEGSKNLPARIGIESLFNKIKAEAMEETFQNLGTTEVYEHYMALWNEDPEAYERAAQCSPIVELVTRSSQNVLLRFKTGIEKSKFLGIYKAYADPDQHLDYLCVVAEDFRRRGLHHPLYSEVLGNVLDILQSRVVPGAPFDPDNIPKGYRYGVLRSAELQPAVSGILKGYLEDIIQERRPVSEKDEAEDVLDILLEDDQPVARGNGYNEFAQEAIQTLDEILRDGNQRKIDALENIGLLSAGQHRVPFDLEEEHSRALSRFKAAGGMMLELGIRNLPNLLEDLVLAEELEAFEGPQEAIAIPGRGGALTGLRNMFENPDIPENEAGAGALRGRVNRLANGALGDLIGARHGQARPVNDNIPDAPPMNLNFRAPVLADDIPDAPPLPIFN